MSEKNTLRKNPSRETCEAVISRILAAEVLAKGKNRSFKQAADFKSYFESLYPASDSLSKQVQRALKSLNLPKDEDGYYIPNKTKAQYEQEREITSIFKRTSASVDLLEDCEPLFLKVPFECCDYLIYTITSCNTFKDKFVTAEKTHNGIIFYTKNRIQLQILLKSLM